MVQISGQVAIDPETDELVHSDDVGAQTIQALNNVNAVLEASGARFIKGPRAEEAEERVEEWVEGNITCVEG